MEKMFKQNIHTQQKLKDENGKKKVEIIKRRKNTRTKTPHPSQKKDFLKTLTLYSTCIFSQIGAVLMT